MANSWAARSYRRSGTHDAELALSPPVDPGRTTCAGADAPRQALVAGLEETAGGKAVEVECGQRACDAATPRAASSRPTGRAWRTTHS